MTCGNRGGHGSLVREREPEGGWPSLIPAKTLCQKGLGEERLLFGLLVQSQPIILGSQLQTITEAELTGLFSSFFFTQLRKYLP